MEAIEKIVKFDEEEIRFWDKVIFEKITFKAS